jgi:hypothetical protein
MTSDKIDLAITQLDKLTAESSIGSVRTGAG